MRASPAFRQTIACEGGEEKCVRVIGGQLCGLEALDPLNGEPTQVGCGQRPVAVNKPILCRRAELPLHMEQTVSSVLVSVVSDHHLPQRCIEIMWPLTTLTRTDTH